MVLAGKKLNYGARGLSIAGISRLKIPHSKMQMVFCIMRNRPSVIICLFCNSVSVKCSICQPVRCQTVSLLSWINVR